MSLTAGTRLGPQEIQSAIGAGGMGEVYKARETGLDRTIAIKVLPPDVSANPDSPCTALSRQASAFRITDRSRRRQGRFSKPAASSGAR